jgi:periplasmic protein TonB
MFEDSLVEPRAGSVSGNKRWTALASISLQFAVAGIVIVLPLLHPEALPFHADTPKVLLALPPRPPVQAVRVEPQSAASTRLAAPRAVQTMSPLLPDRNTSANEAPTLVPIGVGMGIHDELSAAIALEASHGPSVSVAPARTDPLHISWGVSQGMLIAPIRPIYPAIAKAAHVEGKVIVEAIISRTGTIESLHVVSGPPMLRRAAIDAIRQPAINPTV